MVGVRMKIRIQNSNNFLDVNVAHAYLLNNPDVFNKEAKPQLQEAINTNALRCDGCSKNLKGRGWIAINHRPMSARGFKEKLSVENKDTVIHYIDYELKDTWAMFLLCSDTREDCLKKWLDKRPR